MVPRLNKLIEAFEKLGVPTFFTRDWHPSDHISFKERGGLWPPHRVQRSTRFKFHLDLKTPPDVTIVSKGERPSREAYSGFGGLASSYSSGI